MSGRRALRIHPADNVAVALTDLAPGESWQNVTAAQAIPRGHKFCLEPIPRGGMVVKYGAPIGHATAPIHPGEWVHTHNTKTNLSGVLAYSYQPDLTEPANREPRSFQGYRRPDGTVGIRNEIWIIPTVGCVNGVAEAAARLGRELLHGSVDGVYAFPHPYGCSQMGEDHRNTMKALCGLVRHPNAAGVLVLGLGCENNGVGGMQEMLGGYDPDRVKFLVCQEETDELAAAVTLLRGLIDRAAVCEREPLPMSELVVGLKCGGSDGLSGITANPLLGAFSDLLIAEGGSALLTEVPEMFGAETLLMRRCASRAVFDKTVALVNDFKEYYLRHGQVVYENPSPGNHAGGITTLEDKSIGCVQKGGSAAIVDVLGYGEPIVKKGLNLLQGPGNDLVSATAQAASGAHLVLFTTGRGTPFGGPAPTVKISSNSELFRRKPGWIDFDAGVLVDGSSLAEEAERLYRYVQDLASGRIQTRSEEHGVRDIAIFKNGVTL